MYSQEHESIFILSTYSLTVWGNPPVGLHTVTAPMSRPWPKYVREGRNVEVKDKKGFAWPATITEIRHSRDDGVLEAVKVSYTGYASKFDEWVKDAARLNKSRGEEQSAMARAQRGYNPLAHAIHTWTCAAREAGDRWIKRNLNGKKAELD